MFVIIGGGFSGMLAGARLREAGVKDIRILEAGGDLAAPGTGTAIRAPSATWKSYCYLPLLEELGYIPKEKYSYVTEIFRAFAAHRHEYGLSRNPISRPG